MKHEVLSLDFWQKTTIYGDKNFPCGTIGCDALNVPTEVLDKLAVYNELEILFVKPEVHSKGVGYGAWQAIEALHPETKVWTTCTPYFEKRNIYFYVNKCGFHIDEFWCEYFKPTEPMPEKMPEDVRFFRYPP